MLVWGYIYGDRAASPSIEVRNSINCRLLIYFEFRSITLPSSPLSTCTPIPPRLLVRFIFAPQHFSTSRINSHLIPSFYLLILISRPDRINSRGLDLESFQFTISMLDFFFFFFLPVLRLYATRWVMRDFPCLISSPKY